MASIENTFFLLTPEFKQIFKLCMRNFEMYSVLESFLKKHVVFTYLNCITNICYYSLLTFDSCEKDYVVFILE